MASATDIELAKILGQSVGSGGDVDTDVDQPSVQDQEITPVVFDERKSSMPRTNGEYENDLVDDYVFSRSNLYGLLGRTNATIDLAIKLAQMTEHPRAIEVASEMIKTSSSITKDLLSLHKAIENENREKEKPAGNYTQNNTTNNFYGSKDEVKGIDDELDDLDDAGETK